MDLNSALAELGMLSTVTESCKDYVKEKAQKQNKDCFEVVQLNTKYVTAMGPVLRSRRPKGNCPNPNDLEEAAVSLRARKPEPMIVDEGRVARYRRSRTRYSKPYQTPSRSRRITEPSEAQSIPTTSTTTDLSRVSGCQIPLAGAGIRSLSRSKSMDELELYNIQQLTIGSSNHDGEKKQDNVETVAKHMKDLKVK